jgi:hypothetical protein
MLLAHAELLGVGAERQPSTEGPTRTPPRIIADDRPLPGPLENLVGSPDDQAIGGLRIHSFVRPT